MPAPKLTLKDHNNAASLYLKTTMTVDEIAAMFDVSERTIRRSLKDQGICPNTRMSNDDEVALMRLAREQGITYRKLRKMLKRRQSLTSATVDYLDLVSEKTGINACLRAVGLRSSRHV